MKTLHRYMCLLAVSLLAAVPAQAQTTCTLPCTNPTVVEFDASVDHSAVDMGQNKVTGYVAKFFLNGATTPVQSPSLGKPTPVAGKITFSLVTVARPILLAGTYTVKVATVGPGGTTDSVDTDPFDLRALAPAAPPKPVIKQ